MVLDCSQSPFFPWDRKCRSMSSTGRHLGLLMRVELGRYVLTYLRLNWLLGPWTLINLFVICIASVRSLDVWRRLRNEVSFKHSNLFRILSNTSWGFCSVLYLYMFLPFSWARAYNKFLNPKHVTDSLLSRAWGRLPNIFPRVNSVYVFPRL